MMPIDLWDQHACARCEGVSHDVIADEARFAVLECINCGYVVRVEPLGRTPAERHVAEERATEEAATFRFPSGRFVGKTLEEADAEEHGRRYLLFVKDSNPEWRGVIEAYLFQET